MQVGQINQVNRTSMINHHRRALLLAWFVGINVVFYVVLLVDRSDQLMGLWHRLSSLLGI